MSRAKNNFYLVTQRPKSKQAGRYMMKDERNWKYFDNETTLVLLYATVTLISNKTSTARTILFECQMPNGIEIHCRLSLPQYSVFPEHFEHYSLFYSFRASKTIRRYRFFKKTTHFAFRRNSSLCGSSIENKGHSIVCWVNSTYMLVDYSAAILYVDLHLVWICP